MKEKVSLLVLKLFPILIITVILVFLTNLILFVSGIVPKSYYPTRTAYMSEPVLFTLLLIVSIVFVSIMFLLIISIINSFTKKLQGKKVSIITLASFLIVTLSFGIISVFLMKNIQNNYMPIELTNAEIILKEKQCFWLLFGDLLLIGATISLVFNFSLANHKQIKSATCIENTNTCNSVI